VRSSDEIIPALRCAVKVTRGKPVLDRVPKPVAFRCAGEVNGSVATCLLAPVA
jgi:hypothetical protein